jgi:F0F1-type ATP synthase alpha subunit
MRAENRTQDQLEKANHSNHYTTSILVNTCCKQYTYQIGDVSTYIPTNVISITDGHICLET